MNEPDRKNRMIEILMEGDMSRQEAAETAQTMLMLGALEPPYPSAGSAARLVGRLTPRVSERRQVRERRSPWRALALCGFAAIAIFATAFAASPKLRATVTGWFASNTVLSIGSISFVDARHGWLLGVANTQAICPVTQRCGLEMRETNDGGRTWYPIHAPAVYGAGSIYFATIRDGWIYGKGLWSTHDGGRTWHKITSRYTLDLQATAGRVWALESPCQLGLRCHLILRRSPLGRDAWHGVGTSPARTSLVGTSLTVFGTSGAYLLTTGQVGQGVSQQQVTKLYATSNAGATWHKRSAPCASAQEAGLAGDAYQASLTTKNGINLFLMCGGMPGAGEQPKALFASQDGGRQWHEVTFARAYRYEKRHPGGLPENGYIGQFHESGSGKLWLALYEWSLMTSTDGGRTWRQSLPWPQPDTNGGGLTAMAFAGRLQAWAVGDPRTVFHTTDGGRHWTYVQVK